VLPFGNTIAVMGLRGADLLAAIEHGVSQGAGTAGRFPQVAGIRFAWDPTAPPGSRVRDAQVAQGTGLVPVDPGRVYRVVTNDFMRKGGDGYVMFRDRAIDPYDTGPVLDEVLADAITRGRFAGVPADGRIAVR
jgi:5'-nucleotidase